MSREARLGLGLALLGVAAAILFPVGGALRWQVAPWVILAGLALGLFLAVLGAALLIHGLVRGDRPTNPPATPAASDNAEGIARSDPNKDLVVTILEERFFPFRHRALIGELKVGVYNNADHQVDLTGFAFIGSDPSDPHLLGDSEVMAEVRRIKAPRQRISGVVDPGETVIGYHVVAFPHMPAGGRPGYEVFVEDAVGDKYGVAVPRRNPRDFVLRRGKF